MNLVKELSIKNPLYNNPKFIELSIVKNKTNINDLLSNFQKLDEYYEYKLDNLNLIKLLYFNRNSIQKILYDSEKIIKLDSNKGEKNLSYYFYLSLLIKENDNMVNYSYNIDFIKEVNNLHENNTFYKNIIISKIILELINNYKQIDEDNDNNLELENLEKDNIKKIEDNIHIFKKLKLNYDKTNIISKRIDELYADIIIGLFENTDIDYIYKIIEELNFESIDITEKIFKSISVFLNNNEKFKNEYLIINNDDLLNDNKINFYYLLLDYILKNSTFIYQFNCILKTKKYFLKLIKSNSNFYLSNNKNNKLEKIIKKIIDSNYY